MEYEGRNFTVWSEENFYEELHDVAQKYVDRHAFPYHLAVDNNGDIEFWNFQEWQQTTSDLEQMIEINQPEDIVWCTWVGPEHHSGLYEKYVEACKRMDDFIDEEGD